MSSVIRYYEQQQIQKLTKKKLVPKFRAGDTIRVKVKVIDAATERFQTYEGVVIAKKNRGLTSSFVVRKVSHGEGVERRFLTYSPMVAKIEIVKHGIVRRAKLYYLRNLSGKAARITERKIRARKSY